MALYFPHKSKRQLEDFYSPRERTCRFLLKSCLLNVSLDCYGLGCNFCMRQYHLLLCVLRSRSRWIKLKSSRLSQQTYHSNTSQYFSLTPSHSHCLLVLAYQVECAILDSQMCLCISFLRLTKPTSWALLGEWAKDIHSPKQKLLVNHLTIISSIIS